MRIFKVASALIVVGFMTPSHADNNQGDNTVQPPTWVDAHGTTMGPVYDTGHVLMRLDGRSTAVQVGDFQLNILVPFMTWVPDQVLFSGPGCTGDSFITFANLNNGVNGSVVTQDSNSKFTLHVARRTGEVAVVSSSLFNGACSDFGAQQQQVWRVVATYNLSAMFTPPFTIR